MFTDNIHLLNLHPDKWLKSSRSPIINDNVIFVFNDSNYTKDSITWILGRITKVDKRKVSILYTNRNPKNNQILEQSLRDISVIYSVGEMVINTREHFKACNEQFK